MKLTEDRLRQIIREEAQRLNESNDIVGNHIELEIRNIDNEISSLNRKKRLLGKIDTFAQMVQSSPDLAEIYDDIGIDPVDIIFEVGEDPRKFGIYDDHSGNLVSLIERNDRYRIKNTLSSIASRSGFREVEVSIRKYKIKCRIS